MCFLFHEMHTTWAIDAVKSAMMRRVEIWMIKPRACDGSYHTRCLQAVRASRMVGCRRDARAESTDRRRRGIRRGDAIADEPRETDGGNPLRLPRDVRAVTRRATPSTRDAIASSCTAAHRSMRDSRLTESYGTTRPRSRRASRASDARNERNVFSVIRSRARVASRSTASSSARRVASPVASGGRAPRRLFSSPPAKIFARASDASIDGWRVPKPPSSWTFARVARGSRIHAGFAVRGRDRGDRDHPAAIGARLGRAR